MRRNGFTFIELMIAVVIGAFITVTAAAAMRGIVSGRQTHQHLTELSDEMRYACGLIKNDLNNIYRNSDFRNAKFELSYLNGDGDISVQCLTFYTVSRKKARLIQPEGDVYEVEYTIKSALETNRSVLTRRYCPVVPGVLVAEDVRAKGILAPVAESVTAMKVRCYNGTEWTDEWNEENGRFPQLVEIVLLAAQNDEKSKLMRSIFITIPRLKSAQDETDQQGENDSQEEPADYESYMSDHFSDTPDEGAVR